VKPVKPVSAIRKMRSGVGAQRRVLAAQVVAQQKRQNDEHRHPAKQHDRHRRHMAHRHAAGDAVRAPQRRGHGQQQNGVAIGLPGEAMRAAKVKGRGESVDYPGG
jgi:threonine aldolase